MKKEDFIVRKTKDTEGRDVLTATRAGKLLLQVIVPKGGVTYAEVERFVEHLKKVVSDEQHGPS